MSISKSTVPVLEWACWSGRTGVAVPVLELACWSGRAGVGVLVLEWAWELRLHAVTPPATSLLRERG